MKKSQWAEPGNTQTISFFFKDKPGKTTEQFNEENANRKWFS